MAFLGTIFGKVVAGAGVIAVLAIGFLLYQLSQKENDRLALVVEQTRLAGELAVSRIETASAQESLRVERETAAKVDRLERLIRSIGDEVEEANQAIQAGLEEPQDALEDPNLICLPGGSIR